MFTMTNRILFLLLIIISYSFGQGNMNGLGLGNYYGNQGTNNANDGINTITPSASHHFNFSNPSTWHNLDYTYLSLSYSVDQNTLEDHSIINGYSGLSKAIWIVPIKTKYSFGLSIAPYINQKVIVNDITTDTFYAFDDTLEFSNYFKRSGGVMALSLGTSYRFNQKISLGITTNVLFGSSRQSESISFGGSDIIQTSRSRYNGLISDLFLSILLKNDLTIYSSLKNTIKPLESVQQDRYLFDDVNANGYHDWISPYFDFPFPDSVDVSPEKRIPDLHNPSGYQVGLNKIIGKKTGLAIEWISQTDNSKQLKNIFLPTNTWIHKTNSINLSCSRFPNNASLNLFDKISLRTGLRYSYHILGDDNQTIREYGCSLGSGFKFKSVGNQLDFNYYFGYRKYPNEEVRELMQQFQVGVSLADVWFVKRRQK